MRVAQVDPNARLAGLDALRGVMALIVVLTHAWYAAGTPALDSGVLRDVVQSGYAAVDVFFVLSGYVLLSSLMHRPRRRVSWVGFLVQRVTRLWPAYAAVLLLVLATAPLSTRQRSWWAFDGPGVSDVLRHVFMVQTTLAGYHDLRTGFGGDQAIWTLSIELQFALVLPLLARWWCRHPWTGLSVAAVIGPCWSVLAAHVTGGARVAGTSQRGLHLLVQLPLYAPHFALGMSLAVLMQRRHRRPDLVGELESRAPLLAAAGVSAVLGALVALALLEGPSSPGHSVVLHAIGGQLTLGGVALLIPALVLAGGGFARRLASRPLRLLGTYSYCVYLLNLPVITAMQHVEADLGHQHLTMLGAAIAVILAYGLAVPLHHLVEVPVARGGRRTAEALHRRFRPAEVRMTA